MRVLVVEDHADGREALCSLVELWGYECRSAEDGPAGVELALSWRPQAAFVDLGLPGMNGLVVGKQVRAALGMDVLLVLLTAYADGGAAGRDNFDHHFVKPADPDVLRRLLDVRAELVQWEEGGDR
jgi:two-component system CheB/CheR fusion protein